MTLSSVSVDSSDQSGKLVGWKYVEVVFAVGVNRSAQCGRPRRHRTREWERNQLRCPFRLAVLEAHNEDLTPKPVDTLTPSGPRPRRP